MVPGPGLNRHARNERGIFSSLDRDIIPDKPYCFHSFTVFIWVLKGYRGLFVSAECQQPGGLSHLSDSSDYVSV